MAVKKELKQFAKTIAKYEQALNKAEMESDERKAKEYKLKIIKASNELAEYIENPEDLFLIDEIIMNLLEKKIKNIF